MARLTITIIMALFMMLPATILADSESNVIINYFSTDGATIRRSEIEDIFTLRVKRWNNGIPVKIFLLPRDHHATKAFTRKYLGMTSSRYYDLIEGRESSGRGNIFTVLESEVSIIIKVMTTPGSIGYASSAIVANVDGDIITIK